MPSLADWQILKSAEPKSVWLILARQWAIVLLGFMLVPVYPTMADPADTSYRLVFAEECNGTSVDTGKWAVASPSWTMPNSLSTASASQVSVAGGVLTLNATRTSSSAFSSGSVSTYGKLTWTSGYFEASIDLPSTPGSWPAFWGLYTSWPPEADIMEYPLTTDGGTSGLANNAYNTNFHYTNSSGAAAAGAGAVTGLSQNLGTTGYHTFGMDWVASTSMKFYLDGSQKQSFTNSTVSQMVNMYMILDYACGGWPGTPTTTQWPVGVSDQTKVDWVRVWQKNPNGDTTSNWNINGSGSFSTAANWNNSIVPGYGNQTAYFGPVSATSASITMPTWKVFGNIIFDGTNGSSTAYTIGSSASQTIQLASTVGPVVQATSASTVNQNINARVEPINNITFRNDMIGGQTLNFNSEIVGTSTVTITGSGTTVLNAPNSNFLGTINIGSAQELAILRASANNALGTGSVSIGPVGNSTSARLELTGGCSQASNIAFQARNNSSVGIENLNGNNMLAGNISANVGGNIYLIQSDAGTLTISGTMLAASGARTLTLQGAGNGVVNGAIQNGGGTVSIVKDGAGIWALTGSNTYTGTTTITNGTLRLAPNPAVASYTFDNVSGSTVINSGSGGTAMNGTLAGGATIVAGGRFGNAVSLSGGAYVNINNPIVDMSPAANWTVSAWVKTSTVGSTILSKGSGTSWTTGNTIFYLGDGSGAGSGGIPSGVRYAGGFFQGSSSATTVNDGAWHMITYVNKGGSYAIYVDGVAQALSSGNSSFGNADVGTVVRLGFTSDSTTSDGTVNLNGLLDEVQFYGQALSTAQIVTLYHGQTLAGSLPSTASITVANNGTLDVNNINQTLSSVSGAGSLSKSGTGTLTLTSSIAFTGATSLSSGTLAVNGSLPAGGTLTTATGSVLMGSGTINASTTINGTHQPGLSAGTQTFGTLIYGNSAHLVWELGVNSTTSGFDQVTATGAVTINSGAMIDVVLNGTGSGVALTDSFWTQSHSWPILTAASVSGTFALGTVSSDPTGHSISNYGALSLQQTGTSAALTFMPLTAQQLWQQQYFGLDWNNSAIAGNQADPDNDGISNLVEWALGLNPTKSDAVPWTASTPGLPVQTMLTIGGKGYLSLQVRRPTGRTGITYSAEVSSDLTNWSAAVQEGTASANGDGSETVIFRDTIPRDQAGKRFIRLKINSQ